jgi:glutaredoxin
VPQVPVTLLTKPGCHLCDDARVVVESVLAELPAGTAALTERNIQDDPALLAKHGEEIPVVFIGDRMHAYWRVDADRLRRALLDAAR